MSLGNVLKFKYDTPQMEADVVNIASDGRL